ncbi:MAG: TolB protein [Candidatus Krumholzibacteriia bacterium]|jgi:TolB protein
MFFRTVPFFKACSVVLMTLIFGVSVCHADEEWNITTELNPHLKTDVQLTTLDVLSGGEASVEAADLLRSIIEDDLVFSGMFRVGETVGGPDSLAFSHVIEGTIEGPLRDADQTGESAPITVSFNLMTWPERQLIMNKRYRPLPSQLRATAHHFANEIIYALTGEPGITLSQIVFSRSGDQGSDLYAVDYDGASVLRMTANRNLNLCPSWSPDGSEIAFTSYRNHQQGLYILNTANGKVRQVLALPGLNYGADWHPDGKELLISLSKDGNPEIYRISPKGKIIKRLTVSKAIEISPSWSPGGRDLVFTSDRTGTPQLYIIDSDGVGRRRLTFEGRYNDSAVWSPNGDKIAYATREGNYTQIVVMDSTGENRRVVTDRKWRNCEDPSWAPDGRHLVFASDRSGVFKLYVYDDEEGSFRQLTFGDEPDISPAWSN